MSMTRPNAAPKIPTLPRGEQIASYATYLEAQKAVDYLSDQKFAVQNVTIVGTDLKMVERVTGRLTYGRVAIAGLAGGAWFGLFVGLLLYFIGGQGGAMIMAIGLGAGFGLLFSVLSYALAGGKRDFTSSSQIVASAYSLLCVEERSGEARQLLSQLRPDAAAPAAPAAWGSATGPQAPTPPTQQPPVAQPQPPTPAAPAPSTTQPPATPDPRWTTPSGQPRYGAMRPDAQPTPPTPPSDAPPADAPSGDTPR